MNYNQRQFNVYVFLSTFARNLIEVFIPIILYKNGFSIKEVIFYYFLINIYSLFISYPLVYLSNKYSNKLISIIGICGFALTQFLLTKVYYNICYLFLISFTYALYRRGYWLARRYYNMKVIQKNNVSKTYSFISIVNQLAIIFSTYIGALLLDYLNTKVVTILAFVLFTLSIIPLCLFKFKQSKTEKISFNALIKMPFSNKFLIGSYELLNTVKFLFALYIYIYIKNNYQAIGLLTLVSYIATLLFVYFYGKKINGKKNYLSLSILLTVIVYVMKANVNGYLLLLMSFLEGLFTRMYELSISKEFFIYSKDHDYNNVNLAYEMIHNFTRGFATLICLFLPNLKMMIYFVLLIMILSSFVSFKQEKN